MERSFERRGRLGLGLEGMGRVAEYIDKGARNVRRLSGDGNTCPSITHDVGCED
jgi:hypothetical protein